MYPITHDCIALILTANLQRNHKNFYLYTVRVLKIRNVIPTVFPDLVIRKN